MEHSDSEVPNALKFHHVIATWYRRARESQLSHYKVAALYTTRSRMLGVATVILSALTGSTLFATLHESAANPMVRLVLGLFSMAAAAMAALQTSLGYSERANQHRAAGALYGSIRREMECYQAFPPTAQDEVVVILDALRTRLDEASNTAPDVPRRLWQQVKNESNPAARTQGFSQEYWAQVSPPGTNTDDGT